MQYINYRENRRRGTADFPLEYYHVTASHPQYVMSFHWHVEFELIRILSGSFFPNPNFPFNAFNISSPFYCLLSSNL